MKYYKDLKTGQIFAFDDNGSQDKLITKDMVSVSQPAPTVDIEQFAERAWRNKELVRSDIELNKVQDSDPKVKGTVSQWRDYRKALRAWPENTDFPNKDKRPLAPDA